MPVPWVKPLFKNGRIDAPYSPINETVLNQAMTALDGVVNGGSITAVGDITITADSDANAAGDVVMYLGAQERLRITNGGDVKVTSPPGSAGNGLNVEHDSTTTPALRLRQISTGPVAKWRVGTTDLGFINNDGSIKLLPNNGRAMSVEGVTWASGRAYGFSGTDGLFHISSFTDASGAATPTYTNLYGAGLVTKTGLGNIHGFSANITHQGAGEAGLFIGSVTADAAGAAGNVWGGDEVLNLNIAVNAWGHRIVLAPSVDVSTKTQYALEIQNSNDSFALTQGIRLRGNFTNPIIVYSDAAGTTQIFTMAANGNITAKNLTTGTIAATGQVQSTTSTDGAILFRMNTDRPWSFKQVGTAGSTALRLCPDATTKVFRITAPATNRAFEVSVDDTVASSYCWVMPETGGKVGFYGTTPILKPTGTPAAATDLATAISLVNSLRTNLLALGLVG